METQLKRAQADRQSLEERLRALRVGARPQEIESAAERAAAGEALVAFDQAGLARYTLTSPISGVILDRHVELGEVVSPGAPVVTIGDPRRPYVEVFVAVGELASVRLGQRAAVRVDGLDHTVAATVEHLGEEAEFTPRFLFSERERPNLVFRVRLRVDDPREELRAGLPAFVELEGSTSP